MIVKNYKIKGGVLMAVIVAGFISCKKSLVLPPPLANGSVYIKEAINKDTLNYSVSADDSIEVITLHAAVKTPVTGTHILTFGVDTSQLAAYRAKYGNNIQAFPAAAYLIATGNCQLPNGSTQSSAAELNITSVSQLSIGTYVLPIVIKSVDDATDAIQKGSVIYVVIKVTSIYGTPIDKSSWKIVSFSSAGGGPASNVLDNNQATIWETSLVGTMPQNAVIDMGQEEQLKAVTYSNYGAFISFGGTPTSVQIELSNDGVNWTSKQTFTGLSTGKAGDVINLKLTQVTAARYIRFTILQVQPFFGLYDVAIISEIGANN